MLGAPNRREEHLERSTEIPGSSWRGWVREELNSWAPSDFTHGSKEFTKSVLRHEIRTGTQGTHSLDVPRSSKFLGWQKWKKRRDREKVSGEQRRDRTETGAEKHKGEAAPRRNKVRNLSWIGKTKSHSHKSGRWTTAHETWNFIPSRWWQILKQYSGRQWGAFKTKPSLFYKSKTLATLATNSTLWIWKQCA